MAQMYQRHAQTAEEALAEVDPAQLQREAEAEQQAIHLSLNELLHQQRNMPHRATSYRESANRPVDRYTPPVWQTRPRRRRHIEEGEGKEEPDPPGRFPGRLEDDRWIVWDDTREGREAEERRRRAWEEEKRDRLARGLWINGRPGNPDDDHKREAMEQWLRKNKKKQTGTKARLSRPSRLDRLSEMLKNMSFV